MREEENNVLEASRVQCFKQSLNKNYQNMGINLTIWKSLIILARKISKGEEGKGAKVER